MVAKGLDGSSARFVELGTFFIANRISSFNGLTFTSVDMSARLIAIYVPAMISAAVALYYDRQRLKGARPEVSWWKLHFRPGRR